MSRSHPESEAIPDRLLEERKVQLGVGKSGENFDNMESGGQLTVDENPTFSLVFVSRQRRKKMSEKIPGD